MKQHTRRTQRRRPERLTWLFGENRGATMNNNSWYAFRHLVMRAADLPVDAYFVVRRTKQTRARVAELPKRLRQRVLWRGRRRHREVFAEADRFFVTLTLGDVEPIDVEDGILRRVPLVHLQHGTIGVKAVGYRGDLYGGTIDAFCTYNAEERALLAEHNGFATGQLYDAGYHPRYAELLRRAEASRATGEILWFLTWRDYLSPEHVDEGAVDHAAMRREVADGERAFVASLLATLEDPALAAHLEQGRTLRVVFHQFFSRSLVNDIAERIELAEATDPLARVRGRVTLRHGSDVDVMDLMARAETLITDYSSLAYDMTFLGRPICLYHFDLERYLAYRNSYVDLQEVFTEHVAHEPHELASVLEGVRGTLHPYYATRVQSAADAETRTWVRSGGAIDRLLRDMLARDAALLGGFALPVHATTGVLAPRSPLGIADPA